MNNRLIKSNDAGGGGACTNTVDLYNPFPDGGGVALYQLNGDATDVSGNYDATTANAITYGTGEFGQAAQFNGSSSYVLIPDSQALRLTEDYTISFWFKTNSIGANQRLINKDNANDFSGGYALLIESNGTMTWGHNDGSTNQNWNIGVSISANTWYYVTAVYSGNSNLRSFYLNNVLQDTRITNTNIASETDVLLFGAYGQSGPLGQYFNGSLDQVRIFNRALRPYEVEALYTEEYCTPTIVPSEHFNTVTYTGNGGTQSITGVGFEPDFVWIKPRSFADNHVLADSVRGINKSLASNTTSVENSLGITSFDSDGFSLPSWGNVTSNGNTFVSWNFKAGGAAVTNTDGTITSQVSANTEAGFSVVKYTGNNSDATIGHGLSSAPEMMIVKNLDNSNATFNGRWFVYHSALSTRTIYLNLTDGATGLNSYPWNSTAPTSAVFSVDSNQSNFDLSILNNNYIAYCFHSVEGFSSIGSYVGNGSTSGPTVVTGFEPAFLLIKQSSASGEYWNIWDNKRSVENPRSDVLFPNLSNAESSNQSWSDVQFLENGFQVTPSVMTPTNANGATYIYMAFAADPTAVEPTLEDSFNTVTYTGNGNASNTISQLVTGVGFQPDFVWGKNRDYANNHVLFDSVRLPNNWLASNTSSAESNNQYTQASFTSDGFYTGTSDGLNKPNNNFVAWAWKGAEIPAINSNGSIPSVVSANPAAGFSIVEYTAGGTANVGHGLDSAPAVIITKNLDISEQWFVYHKDVGTQKFLGLNTNSAAISNSGVYTSITDTTYTNNISSTSRTYINYCFAEVAGFSKFGSYTGNGSTNGPTITTDFEPAFVMIKSTSAAGSWIMHDNKRGNYNNGDIYARLQAESSDAEYDDYPTTKRIDISSTGFQVTTASNSWNGSGRTYIYMAFANQF